MAAATSTKGSQTPSRCLGLGCVQLGRDYGAASPSLRPSDREARKLLARATELGIRVLDTAPAYGDSETRIGTLTSGVPPFDLVTKVSWRATPAAEISVKASLEALRTPQLHGLLAHSADELLDSSRGAARFAELERLRDDGRVRRIGASVYTPAEARALLSRFSSLDLMQLPLSVLDARFARSGVLAELRERGAEVHVRSVLLQGALALEPEALPQPLAALRGALGRFRSRAFELGMTPVEAAIGAICARSDIDVTLVGASSVEQLEACAAAVSLDIDVAAFEGLEVECSDVIDPRRWRGSES